MNGWGTAVRIATRDALKHKVRSALVLLLIALPVLVVSAALVVMATSDLDSTEQIERRMGAADAVIWTEGGSGPVTQQPDPFTGNYGWAGDRGKSPGEGDITAVLGADARLIPLQDGWFDLRHKDGAVITLEYTAVDLRDPLAAGLFDLAEGELPDGPREIVVNEALRERGYDIGETLDVPGADEPATVVGVGRDATVSSAEKALGPVGSLVPDAAESEVAANRSSTQRWLVDSAPVSWAKVQELNKAGFVVGSRFVLTNPPSVAPVRDEMDEGFDSEQAEYIAVAVLVIAMALLEVVLLAGPAFAVTARNHARTLALITASGGTPAQARRVILAGGLVLGGVATLAGLLLGIVSAWLLMPLAQRLDYSWFGPFDVPWLWLAVVAACGLGSAFGAAFVPAWIASRQDPVAVLAGRRADPSPSRRQPLLGVGLLALGIAGATYGAFNYQNLGSVLMAASALVAIFGMILTVRLVLSLTARAARGLPLSVRYAVRDAARHRTRTVPAVAAVAATVAGVVALGIAASSDALENKETYHPMVAIGDGQVSWWSQTLPGEAPEDPEQVWGGLEAAAVRVAPEVEVRRIQVLREYFSDDVDSHTSVRLPGAKEDGYFVETWGGWDSSILVDDDALGANVSSSVEQRAEEALASGKVVVFTDSARDEEEVVLRTTTRDRELPKGQRVTRSSVTLPAAFVVVDQMPSVGAVVPTDVAKKSALDVSTGGLLLRGDLDKRTEKALQESLRAVATEASVTVERGYERNVEDLIVIWVLAVAGSLLMLVGTLTATFLAVADARPDLATLSAVGASPKTRRGVAGAYALTIGGIGAVLGALVGFVPGVAVSRPLTNTDGWNQFGPQGPFLDIPWLLILGIVVALPLFTAAVVWLSARSRLPMVQRID